MQKSVIFLMVVGSLIAIGFFLSIYGSQLVIEDLITQQVILTPGELFEVQAELDPAISDVGVFVVQVSELNEVDITAKILDPFGTQMILKSIDKESYEERFKISSSGTYSLIIENSGQGQSQVIGVIGHMPGSKELSVGITGFYILVVGLIGIVALGVLLVRNRRKK